MIGYFPTPYPDELLYSICSRFFDRVQYSNKEAVNSELFGARGIAAVIDLPSHLKHLASNLPHTNEDSCRQLIDKFINNHTLLPLYSPFLPLERVTQIRKAMESSNGSVIHNKAGITPSTISLPNWLRFCPVCVEDDRKKFGECYWHRLHQVPGVEVCPLHNVFLENSNVRARNRVNTSVYVSTESAVLNPAARPLSPNDPDHQTLVQIARDATWLLAQKNLVCDSDSLRKRYSMLLAESRLLLKGNKVSVKGLIQALRKRYSNSLLERLQCQFDEKKRYNWPSLIIPHIDHNKTDPPIRHLLLIQLLRNSVQSFLCRPIEIKFHERCSDITFSDVKPFGDGPWPCLNPVCKQSRNLTIKSCSIKYKNKRGEEPVGTFSCKCGFSYKRKGPDKSQEDRYRYDRIQFYGSILEAYLRKAWTDSSLSLRQIALMLRIKWDTVKALATRMNLVFPRQGPGPRMVHAITCGTKRPKQFHYKKQKHYHLVIRSLRREEWLSIRKKYPNANRKKLRRELAPRAHSWLYKHDKKWLLLHSPPPLRRVGSARQVDWKKRDLQLATKVRASTMQLRSVGGRPVRITKRAIARELDELTSITYKKALVKLPLTAQALEEVIESRVEFAIRRIQWAADQFRQQKIIPALATLGQRAGINHSIWYVPEVKTAFEKALLLLQQEVTKYQVNQAA
jgi:hypothetical protein